MSLRYDLSIKTSAELREEGHALARSFVRSLARARWKQNQTPNTHKGARACPVSSSYPGSCSESLGLPEVTWLASASIAQSPTNSKHTHTHTHTRALQPQLKEYYRTGSASVTRGFSARSRPSQEGAWLRASGNQSGGDMRLPIYGNHAPCWLAAFDRNPIKFTYNQEALWKRKRVFKTKMKHNSSQSWTKI